MEACAGAHYWAREIAKLGHHVRLIAPAYVKPFIKRQKSDAADAEAICEAAQRPSMRFVPVKTEEQQANGIVFRARDLLVRQRTQCVNAENDVGTGSSQTRRWSETDSNPRFPVRRTTLSSWSVRPLRHSVLREMGSVVTALPNGNQFSG